MGQFELVSSQLVSVGDMNLRKIILAIAAIGVVFVTAKVYQYTKIPSGKELPLPLQPLPGKVVRTETGPASRKIPSHIEPFLLPFNNLTFPFDVLEHKPWFQALLTFVSNLPIDKVVHIVSADSSDKLISQLLNWLCNFRLTTSSSMSEVLIVALDADIHEMLQNKGFNSVLISNEDIFCPDTELRGRATDVWMKRVTVARIINHLGCDVMMLDLNALLLKDVMGLLNGMYNSSDIVGSIGGDPPSLRQKWGFAVCMGAVFFRNTNRTEKFWNAVAQFGKEEQDDQKRINEVLYYLKTKWTQDKKCVFADNHKKRFSRSQHCTFEGRTNDGLAVTVLSQLVVCRRHCPDELLDSLYILHYYGRRQKKIESIPSIWRVKNNWKEILEGPDSVKGVPHLIDQLTRPDLRKATDEILNDT